MRELPEWVAEAERQGRIPVGELAAWCRWPVGMVARYAEEDDTLVSIAGAEFPQRCLACHSEFPLPALRAVQQEITGEALGLEDYGKTSQDRLDRVPCPACATVGLWPPTRGEKEMAWANPGLWETYGPEGRLPAGQEVKVPELCGHPTYQSAPRGPAPVHCERGCAVCAEEGVTAAHVGTKAERARARVLSNAKPGVRVRRRRVDLDAAAAALAEKMPATETREDVDLDAETGGETAHSEAPTATQTLEKRPDGVTGRDAAAVSAGAALVATLAAVEQPPKGIRPGAAGTDAYGRAWSSLQAGVRGVGDSIKHFHHVVEAVEALAAQRAELEQRVRVAEAGAETAGTELAEVRAQAEETVAEAQRLAGDAETRAVQANSRAEVLEQQLKDLQGRYDRMGGDNLAQTLEDALEELRAGGRKTPRVRLSAPQKEMLALIAGQDPDQAEVARVVTDPRTGNSAWFVRGVEAEDGPLKTLRSLQDRGLITWWDHNDEGVAAAVLTQAGKQVPGGRSGKAAGEARGAGDRAAERESEGAVVPDQRWWEKGIPPSDYVVEGMLQKVRQGRISWAVVYGSDDQDWHQSNAVALEPVKHLLNWMFDRKLIAVADDGVVHAAKAK
ncbi:hypothetical protein [Nocardia sp. NPDC050435]|uniref:hypothetical protein n=1 Tax=Nocardia sp. NPDC050435 TaxID=3155040 RepID=UPI0033EA7169